MFKISLKNNISFECDDKTSIFDAAKKAGIFLEHSCLTARCRSCACVSLEGSSNKIINDLILTEADNKNRVILTCNTIPTSNMVLDLEDLELFNIEKSRILPAKIDSITKETESVIKVVLRLPQTSNFKFLAGQYVNIIKGSLKRSYSIANASCSDNKIEFYIKAYKKGQMSQYWFNDANINDLLRIEGPLGTFFYRENESENIILLATGTGIAPVKSILEQLENNVVLKDKTLWLFWGGRSEEDIFWRPNFKSLNFIPVLSRADQEWAGEKGYVQDVVLKKDIDLKTAQVYACGSNDMITSAKQVFMANSLPEHQFYSDAFVSTN